MVKRIDFHIHTVPSIKDSHFNFSIEWLKAYVDKTKLDAIAITNHDLFNKNNFEEISEYLPNVKVYPGIELALDIGHVNIVFPCDCIDVLSQFSEWLSNIHQTKSDSITSEQLREQLPCWDQGIYIFELGKSKGVKEIPNIFSNLVCVGGVPNQLRFNITKNNPESLVPCLFSDAHATNQDSDNRNDIAKLQNKQTYLQIDSCEFEDIKKCLRDKSKVNFAEYLLQKEVKLLDSEGVPASGGQAVGFALMLRLNEAKNKPIILIDEPESSLDNAYIKNELNKELKQLARNSMVVVITHNSTLGTLLEPDYLIITSKDNGGNYSIMSGEFSSSKIKDSINGTEEKSYEKFIEAMESGMDSYTKKGEIYANLNE